MLAYYLMVKIWMLSKTGNRMSISAFATSIQYCTGESSHCNKARKIKESRLERKESLLPDNKIV